MFGVYIVVTCKGTNITDYNKRMFFWTRLCQEIRAAIWKGEDNLTFNACLEAGVEAEMALLLNFEYKKAFKSGPKRQVSETGGKDKSKGEAHHNSGKGRSLQGASQCSRCNFSCQGRVCGCGSHGQAGYPQYQGDRSGALGAGTPQRPSTCKSCGKFGPLAQDCKGNPPEGSAASALKQKPLGQEKAQ